jgi:hypothetical protein
MKLTRAALALLAIGLAPATAQARVALVASETPELPLVDLGTDRVVDRIALPGPGSAGADRRQRAHRAHAPEARHDGGDLAGGVA